MVLFAEHQHTPAIKMGEQVLKKMKGPAENAG